MPPVSLRGRTLGIALEDLNTQIVSYVPDSTTPVLNNLVQVYNADYSNNYIYYNQTKFNDQFDDIDYSLIETAGDQLIDIGRTPSFEIDWVLYRQNIFPSIRNEFISQSRNKVGYNNRFWKANQAKRILEGNTYDNSQHIDVSQSCWILDAPSNFKTRKTAAKLIWPFVVTGSGILPNVSGSTVLKKAVNRYRSNQSGSGELQNTYSQYFLSANGTHRNNLNDFEKGGILTPGALYSLKHTTATPDSVTSPWGPNIPGTGSTARWNIFRNGSQIDIFGGEAYWDAPEQAGIIVPNHSTITSEFGATPLGSKYKFEKHRSRPWFNSYNDFNYLIKKVSKAKEFAIVPEYRLSEHVAEYIDGGIDQPNNFNIFNFPSTKISSSQQSFYVDYSNSEFLHDFLKLDEKLGMVTPASEIRLVCSGVIRYNPYKSFYPAQRSLDLAEQFYKSYALPVKNADGSFSRPPWGNSGYGNGVSGSLLKSLYQPLFAPGILYNSIKSGLAVDFPVLTDFNRKVHTKYGTNASINRLNYATTCQSNLAETDMGKNGTFWNRRLPFDAIINPQLYLQAQTMTDMDSHPSCSTDGALAR